jgi:hypothetical protein
MLVNLALALLLTLASTEAEDATLAKHFTDHGLAPVVYLETKLKAHDVVFVGETHWIRENCELVSSAVEPLYRKAGLRRLATEFLRTRHMKRMNGIVTAKTFDEKAVIEIFRDAPWPTWGFRDYLDIFRAVWAVNASLPEDAERLLVIGLDNDWKQTDLWFGDMNRRERFESTVAREKHMTKVLDEQAFVAKKKTLVHVGASHAVTCHGIRLATVLRKKYGPRLFQVHLHDRIPAGRKTSSLTDRLERLITLSGGKPLGFDVVGSPLAGWADPAAIWWRMAPKAKFSDLAMGYVYLKPHAKLRRARWIEGFITEEHFKEARAVAEKCGWTAPGECETAEQLDAKLAKRFDGSVR